ncbi:MAG: SpoIIE family protein phosphatase [Acidobacteria bacterium]|nr:SpoIIE family protein phosphatase [Acidobacteriota bacterium]
MKVTLITEEGRRHEISLDRTRMRIGRGAENEISIPDGKLSRHHAELTDTGSGWQVADTGSKNGTFVNGRRISAPTILGPGDLIAFGSSRLVFGEAPQAAPDIIATDSGSERTVHALRVADAPSAGVARLLIDAAREIAGHQSLQGVLGRLLDLAREATKAERGVIATLGPEGRLQPVVSTAAPGEPPPVISRSVLQRVTSEGSALILEDIALDVVLAAAQTLAGVGVRSILCAPLGTARPPLGLIYLDSLRGRAVFEPTHLEVVAVLAGMAAVALENDAARVREAMRRRLEADLAAAADIQTTLLPARADVAQGYLAEGYHGATLKVGGDMYDYFTRPDGFGTMLADVAGKGLAASLLMANLHARWHSTIWTETLPRCLPRLNDELAATLPPNRFVTMAFGLANREERRLSYANAGHTPAILYRDGACELLPCTGPPLGLITGIEFELIEMPFREGDRLVLYSDGAVDQRDAGGEPYGTERLVEAVARAGAAPIAAMLEQVREDIERHAGDTAQDDDLTLTVLALA